MNSHEQVSIICELSNVPSQFEEKVTFCIYQAWYQNNNSKFPNSTGLDKHNKRPKVVHPSFSS